MKLHEEKTLFTQLLNFSANTLNIRPEFIEKDYWLTRALQRMAQNPNVEKVVFKGLCVAEHKPLKTKSIFCFANPSNSNKARIVFSVNILSTFRCFFDTSESHSIVIFS